MDELVSILVVDDEPRNLDVLEVVLAATSYNLIRASSGDEALRILLKQEVALILLDIHMPAVDGFELARIIKASKRFRDVPIIFLTARLLEDRDVMAGYASGGADYLTKPVNPAILRHKVEVFVNLFRNTRALAELNETLERRVQERTLELEQSEAALRVTAQQKDQFLATLAHELRNPLAPLRMGLDILLRKSATDSARTLGAMNRQLDHMVRLIDDLLDVARIGGGKLDLKKERTSLASCICTAIETCRPFISKRRQEVESDLDGSIVGHFDPTRITQIIANLLHNASKFSPDGGTIRLTLSFDAGRAVVNVADTGVGISAEHLAAVFQMFAQVDRGPGMGKGGLGVGLALSRQLAELHDGQLTASSEGAGKGSVFTLTLPAEVELGRESLVPQPISTDRGAPPKVQTLVIEDNLDSAQVLTEWLDSHGYQTAVAHTGARGLELFAELRPAIVLCDIGLPDVGGHEVCRNIRERLLDYRPVLVALTGWGTEEDRQKTKAAGFDHHLVKPVSPDALFVLLNEVEGSLDS